LVRGDRLEIIVISQVKDKNGGRIILPTSMYGARFAARQVDENRVYYDGHDKFPGYECAPHIVAARALLIR